MNGFGLVDVPVDQTTHVVSLRGEIDAATAPRLGSRLFGLAEEGKRAVVVDLSDVTFMDATGIGVLRNALRHFAARHADMVLVCSAASIVRGLEITGVINIISVFESREKALGCFA